MLKDCIRHDMFDDVVRRVQSLLKTDVSDTARHTFVDIELCTSLKSCANIMLCCTIKNQESARQ